MIKIKDLNFAYANTENKAISNLNFEIEKGEVFGFLGPSGAGKTTTQRLIIGLLRGYDGSIEIMGKERKSWDKSIYEKIGVAFDFPNLYVKLSAYENLKLIGSYYKKTPQNIELLLDHVDLLKDKDKKIESFSKGMKMRLNFIRSIMHDPDIVFFDEPTSGLDPVNAKIIKDKILDMKDQGKTIFLTTHNMTVAEQLCDRVAFINDGQLSAIDKPKILMLEHGKANVDIEYIDDGKIKNEKILLKALNENRKFQNILKNYEILSIHSQEASLEDVFILLTGRTLI